MTAGGIPALDRMGAELEAALRARPRRRRRRLRPAAVALVACAALAVPAAATRIDWARLVDGETALPTQAPAGVKTVLASGNRHEPGAWQLVVYRARLAGSSSGAGRTGLCTYVVGYGNGVGRCVPRTVAPALAIAAPGPGTPGVVAGLVSARAERVELSLRDGRVLAVAPQSPDEATLRRRGLPADLRFFVVRARWDDVLAGAVVRDGQGRVLARSGRPRRLPASAPLLRSPVDLAPEEGP